MTSHRSFSFFFFFKTLQTERLKFLQVDTKTTTTKKNPGGSRRSECRCARLQWNVKLRQVTVLIFTILQVYSFFVFTRPYSRTRMLLIIIVKFVPASCGV